MKVLVYIALCVPNDKLYFGITSKTLRRRVVDHLWHAKNRARLRFHTAIRKYGPTNFVWYEIGYVASWADACEVERALTEFFQTRDPLRGYNDTSGGDGTLGRKHTEETKKRIGAANAARPGHRHTEETRARMRVSQRRRRVEPVSDVTRNRMREAQLGKHHTEATKMKLSAAMNGGVPIYVPLDQVRDLLARGRTLKEVSRELGLPYHTIWRRLRSEG